MDVFYVLNFQVKPSNSRKDYWEIYIPVFINILTAAAF